MKKIWLAIAGVVVLAVTLVMTGCGASNGNAIMSSQQQGLWVNGEGKIEVAPDLAVLSLGIESQETSVAEAQSKASEAMDRVLQALKDQGIAEKDIQTQYFNISQTNNWDPVNNKEVINGYRVSNTVTVKVRDITKPGQVIDAVVTAGGNLTRVNGITFTLENPAPKFVDARALALDHAAAKAKEIAEKTGLKLGKITFVSESSTNYNLGVRNYAVFDAVMAVPAPTIVAPVSIGQLEVTATVQIYYAIE